MLEETWKNPFECTYETLCCISTSFMPSDEAIADMCDAKEKGESTYQQFITERLEERSISFFSHYFQFKAEIIQKEKCKDENFNEKRDYPKGR